MKMKKLLVLFSMLAVMFSLAGCDEKAEKPFDYDETQIVVDTMTEFQTYSKVSDEYKDYYISSGTVFEQSAVKGVDQAVNNDKVGEFQDYSEYINDPYFNINLVDASIEDAEDYVSVTILNRASERDTEITVKYVENPEYYINYDKMAQEINVDVMEQIAVSYFGSVDEFLLQNNLASLEEAVENEINYYLDSQGLKPYIPEEMVVSAVYSKSELMGQAGMNTLIGMGTVFVVLIFISFIISLFKYLPALFAKKTKIPEPKKEEAPAKAAQSVPVASENLMNDAELVAVITAAIYAASGSANGSGAVSKDTLVVRSIRRAKK